MLRRDGVYNVFNPGTVNQKTALRNVSLTMKEGDFITLIGGNGAGKSTLLNCIAGVYGVVKHSGSGCNEIDRVPTSSLFGTGVSGPYDGDRF